MSTNNNAKTGNGRVPVIGPGVRHPVPITLSAAAWRGGQVVGTDDRVYFSDGTEWRGIPFADEALSITEAPALVTVGPGGDYGSINAALTVLARLSPPRDDFTSAVRTEMRLLTGYAPTEPVFVSGFNLGWIEMTAVDSEILVPTTACADPLNPIPLSLAVFMSFSGSAPFFNGVNFKLDYTWGGGQTLISSVAYVGAIFGGSTTLRESGFKNFTDNIWSGAGATVDIIWTTQNVDARRYGLEVLYNGTASARGATIRGGTQSVRVRNGGIFSTREQAEDVGAGGITISDFRRTAGVDSSADVFVFRGGIVQLTSGTLAGANIPFNVPTSAGLILKDTGLPSVWPGILAPQSYTVGTLPSASAFASDVIHVSNGDSGAPCLAVSNGTNWLRIPLGAAVST